MKNKFTVGAIAGLSSIALAVPLLTQFANAQSVSSQPAAANTSVSAAATAPVQQADPAKGGHVGTSGAREELLTGDNASKATAAALAAVPGATIDRVETDADGGVYEAHVTKADGSRATVIFDASFNVTEIQDGSMGHGGPRGSSGV